MASILYADEQEVKVIVYSDVAIVFTCPLETALTWKSLRGSKELLSSRFDPRRYGVKREHWIAAKKLAFGAMRQKRGLARKRRARMARQSEQKDLFDA